jgi:hypothetical protein
MMMTLCAAGGTGARKTVCVDRRKSSPQVALPATWSLAVHGCQLVMIRAAAPNLLQVRAGRRLQLRFAFKPDKVVQ